MAIRDLYLTAFDSVQPATVLPLPPPATVLPGVDVIIQRQTIAPANTENVMPILKSDWQELDSSLPAPAISAYDYVTTARKDGTTPKISAVPVLTPQLAAAIARNSAQAKASTPAFTNPSTKTASVMNFVAVLGILGVAWLVFKRK